MATPTNLNPSDRLVLSAKLEWEDPAITLERDLEVRAQGGPGDSYSPQGVLGPFNQSGDQCMATPTPG